MIIINPNMISQIDNQASDSDSVNVKYIDEN